MRENADQDNSEYGHFLRSIDFFHHISVVISFLVQGKIIL